MELARRDSHAAVAVLRKCRDDGVDRLRAAVLAHGAAVIDPCPQPRCEQVASGQLVTIDDEALEPGHHPVVRVLDLVQMARRCACTCGPNRSARLGELPCRIRYAGNGEECTV